MFEDGKATQVAAEMKNYNLTVLRVSETRWTGSGQWRLCCCIQVMKKTIHHTPRVWP